MKLLFLIFFAISLSAHSAQDSLIIWGKESKGLQMGIRMLNDSLEIITKNVSDTVIGVCSHINEEDLDWHWIVLVYKKRKRRVISVGEMVRTGSQWQIQTLDPQESFTLKIDLKYWAKREINENKALRTGKYTAKVFYNSTYGCWPELWIGELKAGPLKCVL